MAVAWVFVATLVAVARSQIESPFQTKYSLSTGPYGPTPAFFDQASPVIYQAPSQVLPLARSPISALNPQQINAPGLKSFNTVSPPSIEDAVAVQVIPQTLPISQSPRYTVIPEGPSSRFINPASPWASIAVLEDGTPVAVVPAADKTPVLAWNPQGSAKYITPQQAIAQPTTVVLEDGTPITVVPVQPKTFQPSSFTAIPQESSVKFVKPQQYLALNPKVQPAYFPESESAISVVPVQAKTFQPSSFTAIPQEPSVKFVNSQQYLTLNPNAQPQPAYFLEGESPISVVPVQAKTFQSSQPQVFAAIPQQPSAKFASPPQYLTPLPTLFGAPSTPLVPVHYPALAK